MSEGSVVLSDSLDIKNVMETAMVDIAYELLKNKGEPIMYQDIMNEVASLKGFTEDGVEKYIAQLYTAINIDGRFTCVGRGMWGLKDWYPIDQTTESAVAANVKDDYLEDDMDVLYDDESDPDPFTADEPRVEIDDLDDELADGVVEDDNEVLLEDAVEVDGLEDALEVEDEDLEDEDFEDEDLEDEGLEDDVVEDKDKL